LINLTMIWSFLGSFIVVPAILLALKPRFLTGRRRGSASPNSASPNLASPNLASSSLSQEVPTHDPN
jgi:hypothetical protein